MADSVGLYEIFGYGGLLAGTVLCCGWCRRGPGRNGMTERRRPRPADERRSGHPHRRRPRRPGPRRALLPSPGRRGPPRALGDRHVRPRAVRQRRLGHQRRADHRPGLAPRRDWPRPSRAGPRPRPGGRHPRAGRGRRGPRRATPVATAGRRAAGGRRRRRRARGRRCRRRACSGRAEGALDGDTWVASPGFPSVWYLAAATAATVVGKAWLPRAWRRASDIALGVLVLVLAIAGTRRRP